MPKKRVSFRWRNRDFALASAVVFLSGSDHGQGGRKMTALYAGLDVSLELTSVCIVDEEGDWSER
jgi:hypothetical protein